MIYQKIHLKDLYKLKYDAVLEIFSPEINDTSEIILRPTVLILPGGGYNFVSHREKDPASLAFLRHGFIAASLTYTVKPELEENDLLFPHPYLQVACAMDYLKKHASCLSIDIHKIGLIGFSAGGHLAGSYSYLCHQLPEIQKLDINIDNLKPHFLVLCYPVISLDVNTHYGTRNIITNGDEHLIQLLSIQHHVDSSYPPTFIWNTLEDQAVPPDNVNIMVEALKNNRVPYQSIQYPHGWHGLSTVDENTIPNPNERNKYKDVASWIESAINFINSLKI